MTLSKATNEHFSGEELFKACFHNYYEGLHRYAFTIVKENEEAKDIVQSVFIKLWERKDHIDIKQSGHFYLYKSVYHLCLNSIRDKQVKQKYAAGFSTPATLHTSHVTEEKEMTRRILNAVETLPAKCREIFNKSRYEGKRYAEIASELNISVKTVEGQMGKALKILRNLLADLIKI